ncbi:hypothetical protein N658DRAFT_246580 [Parathielavia hyrcaniae]|uniref:Uncharacterized protein n=1 Tax=Parathielavia hyrcaniae TaxID=113614 RepID=A0AAN6Q603_9PEZI|nr:hypothetical protein N658DRAFT_246580 [Parathielavia hyrcaniae]
MQDRPHIDWLSQQPSQAPSRSRPSKNIDVHVALFSSSSALGYFAGVYCISTCHSPLLILVVDRRRRKCTGSPVAQSVDRRDSQRLIHHRALCRQRDGTRNTKYLALLYFIPVRGLQRAPTVSAPYSRALLWRCR